MHPILFHIGPFAVHSYGVFLVGGFLVGLLRAMRVATRRMVSEPASSPRRINPDTLFDLGVMGLLVGLVGARILFVLLDWSSYAKRPLDAFRVWEGGLSLHGGMLFGIAFLVLYCRRKRISLLAAGDLCAPSWAIAYAIGRIGCLLNGCCYGAPCSAAWARPFRFPDEQHPGFLTQPSHPTQLYASLFNLFFFFWLIWWERRPRRDGELFFGYIGMYGVYRFIVEMFRAGATSTFIPGTFLTDTHVVSILMLIASLIGIAIVRRRLPAVQDAPTAASRPSGNTKATTLPS